MYDACTGIFVVEITSTYAREDNITITHACASS